MKEIPLEETNLAHIGSAQDKAVKKAAAETEVHWDGVGQSVGIEIWRVENKRDADDNPKFGIKPWPKSRYGEFYRGDSYIVLKTSLDEEGAFQYDIYFWIGSQSSQDEYGVAAYKTTELDALLGDAPVQHREVENFESPEFLACFPNGIFLLDGGIDGGFRHVEVNANRFVDAPTRLFHYRKIAKRMHCFQVPLSHQSLNQGDAFVLDAVQVVYTWCGSSCSPFEKRAATEFANKIVSARFGRAKLIANVQESDTETEDAFWSCLGGKGPIQEADEYVENETPQEHEPQMFVLSDKGSNLTLTEVPLSKNQLVSDDVCLIDTGVVVYIWVGKGSTGNEQAQAMLIAQNHIKSLKKENSMRAVRVLEGQEKRIPTFDLVFK